MFSEAPNSVVLGRQLSQNTTTLFAFSKIGNTAGTSPRVNKDNQYAAIYQTMIKVIY